jgi:hypothetical protein
MYEIACNNPKMSTSKEFTKAALQTLSKEKKETIVNRLAHKFIMEFREYLKGFEMVTDQKYMSTLSAPYRDPSSLWPDLLTELYKYFEGGMLTLTDNQSGICTITVSWS